MGRLANKVAFLSGATSGIGRIAAAVFAREGAGVVLAGRREEEGQAIVQDLRDNGHDALFMRTDVTRPEEVELAIKGAVDHFGRLDILFNNAGGSSAEDGPAATVSLDEFWRTVKVNLYGTLLCSRFGVRELLKGGGGSIINVASMTGFGVSPGMDGYTSAKGGVLALTRAMARDLARRNIRVNALAPAAVATDRIIKRLEQTGATAAQLRLQPLGLVDPEDIAHAAVFLASDESKTLTGQAIAIHGGMFDGAVPAD